MLLLVSMLMLGGCSTLDPDRNLDGSKKTTQTESQAETARKYLYNQQLRSAQPKPRDEASEAAKQAAAAARIAPCESGPFALKNLLAEEISLSNQDVRTAATILSVMGYWVVDLMQAAPGMPANLYGCDNLPVVVLPTTPGEEQLTFPNGAAGGGSPSGYSSPSMGYPGSPSGTSPTGNLTVNPLRRGNSSNLDRLLVFYHPEKPEAFDELKRVVSERVDSASTQVYIETLVVEISREDSKELGVEWQTANIGSQSLLTFGQLETKSGDTVSFERNTRTDSSGGFVFNPGAGVQFKLRALIESGRAQILSRPSVLALSNRQAVIQIVDVLQTPLVDSRINDDGSVTISSYRFEPLLIGITLNLRPRVSADRQWVTMEIDATVDAEVDDNSGEVYSPDNQGGRVLLAEKPGAASRMVRTFARIPDRTPIIIGGLAAANRENQKGRVPVVGELPVIGALFGSTDNEVQERELIIVLTPYVLAEDAISVGANTAEGSALINTVRERMQAAAPGETGTPTEGEVLGSE